MKTGTFIVIDGIAGSGKSTLTKAVKQWAQDQGKSMFDFADWCQHHQDMPQFSDMQDADILFTFEPTKVWVGSAIRQEMSRTDLPYSGEALAQAFSLDRLLMYKRCIIPALAAGKIIIQERSVTTSLVYQPIMPGGIPLQDMLRLPGNALALEYAPDHIVLTDISPEAAIARTHGRDDESKGVFQELAFMKQVHERYRSDWFTTLFTEKGSQIHFLDTSTTLDDSIASATQLLQTLLPT